MKLMTLARVTMVLAGLCAWGSSVAQVTSGSASPQSFDWAKPAPRESLSEKGSSFLSGGKGTFVTSQAIRANTIGASQKVAAKDDAEDAPLDLSAQFEYIFGGIPGPESTLDGGQKLFTACEPHNCVGRRAFMVTDSGGINVLSAGFLSVECAVPGAANRKGPALISSCDTVPTLTIYYQDRQTRQPALALEIIKWARLEVARSKQSDRMKIQEQFLR
ncbi:hypothetical protein [Luteibacter sp.]|uniref:hypothetical protein n=1 Tax=Luteibacter sp. TaxID=1886636 RepID=UPI003F7F0DD4